MFGLVSEKNLINMFHECLDKATDAAYTKIQSIKDWADTEIRALKLKQAEMTSYKNNLEQAHKDVVQYKSSLEVEYKEVLERLDKLEKASTAGRAERDELFRWCQAHAEAHAEAAKKKPVIKKTTKKKAVKKKPSKRSFGKATGR